MGVTGPSLLMAVFVGLTVAFFVTLLFFFFTQRRTTKTVRKRNRPTFKIASFRVPENPTRLPLAPHMVGHTPAQILAPFLLLAAALLLTIPFSQKANEEKSPAEEISVTKTAEPLPSTSQPDPSAPREQTVSRVKNDAPSPESGLGHLLKTYHFIFIYDRRDAKIKNSQLIVNLESWRKWAKANRFVTDHCEWANLVRCEKTNSKRIYVVLPGRWSLRDLEKLMARDESVILSGKPFQMFDKKEQNFKFKNLDFDRLAKEKQNWLIVRGEHKAKTVWLDFIPQSNGQSDSAQAGIFHYLLNKKRSPSDVESEEIEP